jgi:tagaturonate reductase
LKEIVLTLADRWRLEPAFARWVEAAVPFCNTLVDRIVPGAPTEDEAERLQRELGYRDALLTTSEVYRSFVIEPNGVPPERLRFAGADAGIVLTSDAAPYRERKVRLLNGGHTATAAVALLAGCTTVREAVEHELVGPFLCRVVFDEIVPGLDAPGAAEFARAVLDRFANPFIRHALFDITLQGTMKMRVRVVPSILRHAERTGTVPEGLALGFAAHLLFLRGELQESRRRAGLPVPPDDAGGPLRERWAALPDESEASIAMLARTSCADADVWGADLTLVPGFAGAVGAHLVRVLRDGMPAALAAHVGSVVATHPRAEDDAACA